MAGENGVFSCSCAPQARRSICLCSNVFDFAVGAVEQLTKSSLMGYASMRSGTGARVAGEWVGDALMCQCVTCFPDSPC